MKFRLKSKFYIVAYSFGVNIALEVTALLEKEGKKSKYSIINIDNNKLLNIK